MLSIKIKLHFIIFLFLLSVAGCDELGIMNIYNELTQQYRTSDYDAPTAPDSNIIVKVVNSEAGNSLENVKIKLTLPSYDTLIAFTNKDGLAIFKFSDIKEGNYNVKTSIMQNGPEHILSQDFYMGKKGNPLIIVRVNKKVLY